MKNKVHENETILEGAATITNGKDSTPIQVSTSPRRSGRKRKLTRYYSFESNYISEVNTSVNKIKNEDEDDENTNVHDDEKEEIEKNGQCKNNSETTTTTRLRRKPLFPSRDYPQLPPRHTINTSSSSSAIATISTLPHTKGILSNQSYNLPSSLLSSPSHSM